MPTPAKTSSPAIIAAARDLIAENGLDALTMQAVAQRVGVRGPSLYKHFADRAALLKGVELTVVADLEQLLRAAAVQDGKAALRAMADAYRKFALASPGWYALLFQLPPQDGESEAARRRALEPALEQLETLLGDRQLAFLRARALTAFLHGFVSMETAGAFRLGGNVEQAFAEGINLLLKRPKKG
jgi:AcrR family transcriptional regulator